MAVAGVSSLGLTLTPGSVLANELCQGDLRNSTAVSGAIPNLSASFAEDVCQILTMPTASRSEGEAFLGQVQPGSLLTHTSASAETMTLPSMWWARDSIPPQLGRHRLIDSWLSYTIQGAEVRVVDVVINGQFWRALTMPQRYGVLAQFGNSAQEFGYHLRFFQSNGYSARMIGVYACETSASDTLPTNAAAHCLVTVDTPRILQLQQAMQPPPSVQTATEPGSTNSTPSLADNPRSLPDLADLPE
ncbi:MAG: hypothetical protein ACHWZW_16905 [Spirulina sp.]